MNLTPEEIKTLIPLVEEALHGFTAQHQPWDRIAVEDLHKRLQEALDRDPKSP